MKKNHLISNTLNIADLLPNTQSKSFIKEGQGQVHPERVNTAPDLQTQTHEDQLFKGLNYKKLEISDQYQSNQIKKELINNLNNNPIQKQKARIKMQKMQKMQATLCKTISSKNIVLQSEKPQQEHKLHRIVTLKNLMHQQKINEIKKIKRINTVLNLNDNGMN